MPKTVTKRESRTQPSVNYNPMFPGGNNGQRKDNAKARVAYGDAGVNERVKRDYGATYLSPTKPNR